VSSVVLDASALMAFLRQEPGWDRVAPVLGDSLISAVNLSEVIAKATDYGGTMVDVSHALTQLPVEVPPFTQEDAYLAASLRPVTRHLGLSLGDRACLALGLLEGLPVLTADQAWAEADVDVEIVTIR
jgi:ribonuclease VapC